ncbi:MAG: molecular chaperone TorD family protein [Synergistaceae bacterium]|nr:molecular chaperone TorD family protein [Synergistaceae bacterium]
MGKKLNNEDYKIIMEMRQYGYDVLKQIFYVEPAKSLLQTLRDNEIFDSFPFREEGNLIDTGIKIINQFFTDKQNKDDEMTSEVRWDFTQLFVGPYALPAPPWESVYRSNEHLLYQDTAFEVRKEYLKYNFIPKNYPHEADDHIGFELDFMLQLALNSSEDALKDSKKFLDEHLTQWIADFSRDVQKHALTEFYRGAAIILKGFIAEDLKLLNELLDQ